MARRPTHYKGGYEVRRFQTTVDNYFLCMICLKVVKDARMCHQTEHIFCRCCIEEHLRVNAQKCPQCQEKLSVATLLSARFVDNTISKLKIGCEFASRGCPEIITVQDLQSHVENCGFAPVLCSNERCGQVINKRDKIKHETELCEYRKIPSYDFIEIKEMFQQIVNHEAQAKMKMVELNAQMNQSFVGINGAIKETAEPSKTQFSRMQCVITESRKETKDVRQNLSTVTEEMMESREEIKDVRQNLSTVTKEIMQSRKEIKDVRQNLSKVTESKFFQFLEKDVIQNLVLTLPSSIESVMSVVRKDVLVAGGYPRGRSKNVEIFSWKEEKWFESAKMKIGHWAASSFVYNDNLFVVGGCDFNSTEILNLNRHPLTWQTFSEELPFKIFSHKTVVYKEQVLYIGGYNEDKQKTSDMISELQITGTPFPVLKELCHMPEPLFDHGAEVVGDKVLIFGGNGKDEKALSNVSEFDPRTLTFKEMPPLPHPLTRMATVRWRDQVVLLGGVHSCSSNSVIMYDSSTGKTTILPPMMEKRERGCAVLTGNAIVVIGGDNDKGKQLKSVEYFEMGRSSSWSYLPSMIEPRSRAIAEMLPLGNVYV